MKSKQPKTMPSPRITAKHCSANPAGSSNGSILSSSGSARRQSSRPLRVSWERSFAANARRPIIVTRSS